MVNRLNIFSVRWFSVFMVWVGLLGLAIPVKAELALSSPKDLMIRAEKDRRQLREVLLDIQVNVPEMRDPKTFDSYFFLLDDLQILAEKFDLDSIYPKAVETTGLKMVAHGIRWMDLSQRSLADATYYVRYADADTMSRFLSEVEMQIMILKDNKLGLNSIATNLDGLLPLIEKKFEERRDVRVAARQILSTVAIKFLKLPDLSTDEANFWVEKISLPSSYGEYIDMLSDAVLDTVATNWKGLAELTQRLIGLGKKIANETYPLPAYTYSGWGDVAVELILRSIQGEREFLTNEFENLIGYMRSRQLQALASQWMASERLPTKKYSTHYLKLSDLLIARLRAVGLAREAGELNQHISKIAAPIEAAGAEIEGHYELVSTNSSKFHFVIIRARSNLLYASLQDYQGNVTVGFFNVTYDRTKNRYIASQREPDLDATGNPSVIFTLDKSGVIRLEAAFTMEGWRSMKGKRTGRFTNFLDDGTSKVVETEGEWEGSFSYAGEKKVHSVRLIISKFGSYSIGRYIIDKLIVIDFQTGTSGDNGIIYLTTGRLDHTGWVHLRGIRRGDNLEGQVITSTGLSVPYFKLKKVK